MAFASDTAKSSLQKAIYDVTKVISGWLVGRYVQPLFARGAASMSVPGAVAWGTVATVMAVFVVFFALDWFLVRRALPRRIIRRLEYHAMHLTWMRAWLLDKDKTEAELKDVQRVVEKHRLQLLDMTPTLLPQSGVDGFRNPAMLHLGDASALVSGLPHHEIRIPAIARLDQLLRAIRIQWENHAGMRAPHP